MAYQDWYGETTNLYQPDSSSLDFEFDLNLNQSDPNAYRDASITQLFYTANFYHDVLYDLGFTEEAGNFQANNNGKGGKDNDAVILSAQDTYGTDNAVRVLELCIPSVPRNISDISILLAVYPTS